MKLFKILVVANIILVVFSCESQLKEVNNLSSVDQKKIDSLNTQDKMSFAEKLLETYNVSMGDPDTSLVVFLYRNWDIDKWEGYIEEYSRWDLEHDKISTLLKSIFQNEPDYQNAIVRLNQKRELFVDYIRNRVQNDYKNYNAVSGMEFDFLVTRKDSVVLPLLKKLIENPKAPEDEVEYAKAILDNW